MKIVYCPGCREPLIQERCKVSKHFCQNESCPVIFVRYPYDQAKRRVVCALLATERTIEKAQNGRLGHI
ncbi:MAG: hypothetical protein ACE5L6_00445 [Candidatus Bathyarchaeia archaeon]